MVAIRTIALVVVRVLVASNVETHVVHSFSFYFAGSILGFAQDFCEVDRLQEMNMWFQAT